MNDQAIVSDDPAPMNLSVEGQAPADGSGLEQRVQRLEAIVAPLEDTKALEERILERVTERLHKAAPSDQFTIASPAAAPLPYYEEIPLRPIRGQYAWLFIDMIAEARLMFLMLFDRRYAMAWTTHLIVILFFPAILVSAWWFPLAWIPIVGQYLDKVLDLLLAFCIYKALSREVRRYREILETRR